MILGIGMKNEEKRKMTEQEYKEIMDLWKKNKELNTTIKIATDKGYNILVEIKENESPIGRLEKAE